DAVQIIASLPEIAEVDFISSSDRVEDVGERNAVDERRSEDARARILNEDLGVLLQLISPRIIIEAPPVSRLDAIVELILRPAPEFIDDPPRFGRAQTSGEVDESADHVHEPQIYGDCSANIWTLHLHGHAFAGGQHRTMHLPNRRRGE